MRPDPRPDGSPDSKPPGPAGLTALLLLLLVAAGWLGAWARLAETRATLQAREVSSRAFGAGGLGRVLSRLGLVHPRPPRIEPGIGADGSGLERGSFAFGRPPIYGLSRLPRERLAEALLIDPEWLEREAAVVSLLLRTEDLNTFAKNPDGRGREWERRGYFAYVENGEQQVGAFVGVRLHGGFSRGYPADRRSYRVYFRNRYGLDRLPLPLFPGRENDPSSELVIRADGGPMWDGRLWYFTSPLAYDVARRVGCPAPHTRHVRLFVNGQPLGIRALTEFIQRDFLRARFGIQEPILVRARPRRWEDEPGVVEGDPEIYRAFAERVIGEPLETGWVHDNVDVDNLYRWCLAALFCDVGDVFQGSLARDRRSGSRWFWIAWDMDESFGLPRPRGASKASILNRLYGGRKDPRAWLFRHLLGDEAERRRFLRIAVDALNHRLTGEFLEGRWAHYRDVARRLGIGDETAESLALMRRFLRDRPQALRGQLAERLAGGEGRRVRIEIPAGRRLLIDGEPWARPYSGWYVAGMEIELALPPGSERGFSHWLVDGEVAPGRSLRLVVDRELSIRPVFSGRPGGPDPLPSPAAARATASAPTAAAAR